MRQQGEHKAAVYWLVRMIDCIFTLDYELYGNGEGTLDDLVYQPAERLKAIFQKWDARFVVFAEVAELAQIEKWKTDPAIGLVKQQLRDFNRDGFEIGLHLHPQWCNARYYEGRWRLDLNEYNLCTLSKDRIDEIVSGSIDYLKDILPQADYSPLSFRAGNWLFQPTREAASSLAKYGIRIDSSVFKGGLQHYNDLDYRPALNNGYYWSFDADVNEPDPGGRWIEVPIYTDMVPFWKMATSKRLSMKNGASGTSHGLAMKWSRIRDRMRFHYPLKFDFCRMTLNELTSMMERIIREDQLHPEMYRPVVAIGHTKDLMDCETVNAFLSFLKKRRIAMTTFADIYPNLAGSRPRKVDSLRVVPHVKETSQSI